MNFKRSTMSVVIEDYVNNNPHHRKYFYCESCDGKMVFRKHVESILECSKCGKEVKK